MSAIRCPHCDHSSDDPNAWRLPATHPIDCRACGKTFSLEAGQRRAEECRKNLIMEEINEPPSMRHADQTRVDLPTPTQICHFCRSEIDANAQKCPRCQEWLDGRRQPAAVTPSHTFHPGIAAALSFLFPGLGQIYKTQVALGMIWMVLVVIGYLLFIVPGIILHVVCIVNAASSDPVRVK